MQRRMSIVKLVLFFTTSQPPHDRQIYYNAENHLYRQQSCFPCLDRVRKNSLIYRFRILSQRIAVPVAGKANAYALNHISADIHQLCKNNIIFVCIISEKGIIRQFLIIGTFGSFTISPSLFDESFQ